MPGIPIEESPCLRAAANGDVESLEVGASLTVCCLLKITLSVCVTPRSAVCQDALTAGDDIEQTSVNGCTPL